MTGCSAFLDSSQYKQQAVLHRPLDRDLPVNRNLLTKMADTLRAAGYTVTKKNSDRLIALLPEVGATSDGRKQCVIDIRVSEKPRLLTIRIDARSERFYHIKSSRHFTPQEAAAAKELRTRVAELLGMVPLEWEGGGGPRRWDPAGPP